MEASNIHKVSVLNMAQVELRCFSTVRVKIIVEGTFRSSHGIPVVFVFTVSRFASVCEPLHREMFGSDLLPAVVSNSRRNKRQSSLIFEATRT